MAVRGLTIPIGADATQFNKEIKKMEQNTKGLQKEVGALAQALDIEWNEDRFVLAQQKAREALQQTEVKAQALRDRLQYLEEVGTDKQSAHYQKIRSELIQTETQAVLLKEKLEEINKLKFETLTKSFEETGAKIESAGKKLSVLSATAAGILASFSAIGLSAISAADDIATQAAQINLSAEAMQKWNYIAMQTDVSQQDLQNGMMKTQAALSDLATNASSTGATALQRLGLSMEQAALGMDANIDLIITRLSEIEDPIMQASIANELFGDRMGAKFIPLLQSGAEGLQTLTEEFEAVGYMTNEQVNSLAEFDNVMNRLKQIFTNLKNEIGASLLPIMQMLATFIEEKIVPAIRNFSNWFTNLSDTQKSSIASILGVVAALGPFLVIVGKMTSGIGGVVKSLGGLQSAFTSLSSHPIIAIIGVIVALMALMYAKNEEFRNSINNLVSTLSSSFAPILKTVMDLLGKIFNAIVPIIDLIAKMLIPVINILSKGIGGAFDFINKTIQATLQFIEDFINTIIDGINFLIKKINSVGKLVGLTIDEIDKVDFTSNLTDKASSSLETTPTTENAISSIQDTLKYNNIPYTPQNITNNDYSNKEIKVEVIVQNYAKEVDVDEMVRQINLKLAEQM